MPAASSVSSLVSPEALASWIVFQNERVIVVNKPSHVVVHPSKAGPWSSLVGAVREYLGLARIHLVFRLDRETSGVVVLAKDARTASLLQTAVERLRMAKHYVAILHGEFAGKRTVDVPIGPDLGSIVAAKRRAAPSPEAQSAQTVFRSLAVGGGFTVVEAQPLTGRTHQIRAHAEWLGHRVVGDKIYGPSPACFLEFRDRGWNESLAARLLLDRQALHCARVEFQLFDGPLSFSAPPAPDLKTFARERMSVDLATLAACIGS